MRGLPLKRRNNRGRRSSAASEEFAEQEKLAEMLSRHTDPETTWWTSLENRPRSKASALGQRRRGVRSGIPDVMVVFRRRLIFIELKSRSGIASKAQREVRAELLKAGAGTFWLARGAFSAMVALCREGVVFREPWTSPLLEPWEGPFTGAEEQLPQAPETAAQRRAAVQRWRARQRDREAALAAEQRIESDFPTSVSGDGEFLARHAARRVSDPGRAGDQLPSKTKFGP
jgi:hypothetical protein